MQQYFSYLLAVLLVFSTIFLLSEKAYAQSDPTSTDNITKTPATGTAYVSGITAGRARALAGGAIGLISLIIGWRAKVGAAAPFRNVRTAATLALVLGSISIILSIVHLIVTSGAVFGSGSGKAGAIVALVPSLIGVLLGWRVLQHKKATT